MLQLESIHKQFATKVLLSGATAHLRPGARVGLVGPNGAGKTTLFRMILGEESPDKGSIRKRPRLRIGYLPQELETIVGKTVLDAAHRDLYPEHEAKRILSGLGFTETDFVRPIENLSGGYRMRVALAHLLLSNPDVLMLDEPTNHLDKPTQRWFERFLLDSNLTLLVISHDTKFLDAIATHIWELRDRTIQEYRGNYTKFQELRAARDAQLDSAAMIDQGGNPYVVEFNARFGDPETQSVLSVLRADTAELVASAARGSLNTSAISDIAEGIAVCVVLASGGYPDSYAKGVEITGIHHAETDHEVRVFHAGTAWSSGGEGRSPVLVTNGGRVLGVTAVRDTLEAATVAAYEACDCISFDMMYYRTDIGKSK